MIVIGLSKATYEWQVKLSFLRFSCVFVLTGHYIIVCDIGIIVDNERVRRMSGEDDFSYANDPELIEQFVSWTTEAVEELKTIVSNLSDGLSGTSDASARIYDLSHNIKGMGSSFDFPLMTDTGSSLCAYIKNLTGDQSVSQRVVDAHVKVFEVVLTHKIQGSGGEKGDAIRQRLAAIVAEG